MFKFNNSHIFTGYLKQLLSTFNLPTCRIYTKEFAEYVAKHGKEDQRVIESFDSITFTKRAVAGRTEDGTTAMQRHCPATRVNYLKGNELFSYFWEYSPDHVCIDCNKRLLEHGNTYWRRTSSVFYNPNKNIPGLTRTLNSPGNTYDTETHEYLGEYLRFLRDYYGVNLMSLYNCFNNKIYNNVYGKIGLPLNSEKPTSYVTFDSYDTRYRIYAFPVKLFCDYTIAIDCDQDIEMFCGLYSMSLQDSDECRKLMAKTYQKVHHTLFNKPFIYDKLNVKYWSADQDFSFDGKGYPVFVTKENVTRWDIANREQDLKLFIKMPVSCKSSITVLEGNYIGFNDAKYAPVMRTVNRNGQGKKEAVWEYSQNHTIINFGDTSDRTAGLNINDSSFTPISKLQLLAFNTGESYPFADRLIEYLCNSAITPIDEISDNIKRAQKVMADNNHHFKIDGVWEDKMQKIIYDYIINAGPIKTEKNSESTTKLVDARYGLHPTLGHNAKSTVYDILGYVDRDAEKWYASWINENGSAAVHNSIQNVDIYDGLYDI
jgi:hypothetical protein